MALSKECMFCVHSAYVCVIVVPYHAVCVVLMEV